MKTWRLNLQMLAQGITNITQLRLDFVSDTSKKCLPFLPELCSNCLNEISLSDLVISNREASLSWKSSASSCFFDLSINDIWKYQVQLVSLKSIGWISTQIMFHSFIERLHYSIFCIICLFLWILLYQDKQPFLVISWLIALNKVAGLMKALLVW